MPSAAHAGGPSVTLEASKKRLRPPKTTDLSGTLTGVFSGDSGKTVTLYESPYPYEDEEVVTSTTTGQGGAFSFPGLAPELNTRYRVAFDGEVLDGDASSTPAQVYVFARFAVDVLPTARPSAILATFDATYSPEIQPEFLIGRPVYWYFRKTTQKSYKRVEKSRWRDTSSGAHAQATIKLPRSRKAYRYFIGACTEVEKEDVGIGPPIEVNCPQRRKVRSAESATPPSRAPGLRVARP
jgi:hypothetical protein